MITLAVLFVVDQVVKNWTEVTRGAGGLSGVPRLGTDLWLWIAALGALLVANGFHETRAGRFAAATREDEIAAPSIGIGLFAPRYVAWLVSIGVVAVAGALPRAGDREHEPEAVHPRRRRAVARDARGRRHAQRVGRGRRHRPDHGRQRDLPPTRRPATSRRGASPRPVPGGGAAGRDARPPRRAARRCRSHRVVAPARSSSRSSSNGTRRATGRSRRGGVDRWRRAEGSAGRGRHARGLGHRRPIRGIRCPRRTGHQRASGRNRRVDRAERRWQDDAVQRPDGTRASRSGQRPAG